MVDYGIRPDGQSVAQRIIDDLGLVRVQYRGRQPRLREVSEAQLDQMVQEALTLFPNLGLPMLWAYVKAQGVWIPRDDVRASFLCVNGPPARFGHQTIQRRVYRVPGPNSLWHHDGHHSKSLLAF